MTEDQVKPFTVVRKSRNYPPFDPLITMRDNVGNPIQFLKSPLDEEYLTPPYGQSRAGMLPPEEFEVGDALAGYKIALMERSKLGFLGVVAHYFGGKRAGAAQAQVRANEEMLLKLTRKSPEHRAAFLRIVNAMPLENGGREALGPILNDLK